MRISFEWLNELVAITTTADEVAERLTMIGFEVEGMEQADDDTVFEINVTPNRPDCLSIIGIAREVSAAFKTPLKMPLHDIQSVMLNSDFSVEILNPDLCNRYAGRVIKNVVISESPKWIKNRLEKCGIRSINNVVDITNYVLLEYGHPLHAFDADTIHGRKIRVGTPDTASGKKTKMKTLDGVEHEIPGNSLLIWDAEDPIAIAGVMGGLETEVNDATKDIFLESAYFDPISVRRTSKLLNLTSESSYRFERGTDIELLEKALNRAALLISEIAGGTINAIVDAYPIKHKPESIQIQYERINRILGTEISKEEMLDIMQRLRITTEARGDFFVVYPPAFRRDLKRECDIAEEISRLYGYDRIPVRVPRSPLSSSPTDKKMDAMKSIRDGMRESGFTEVINYSFLSPSSLDIIDIPEGDRRRNTIAIRNPLRKEDSLLRTTLVPSLIENLKYNLDRGIKDIRFFEISTVFEDSGKELPLEELRLGGIFYREKLPSLWKEDTHSFFITKGTLESLFEALKIKGYSFVPSSEPFLHKGQSSDIHISGFSIGYIGILAPNFVERLDLKKKKIEVALFEVNLNALLLSTPDSIHYSTVPKYPYIERDIAIIVDEAIPAAEITKIITAFPSELIEEVSIFDYYKGGNIPAGKKSLAFSILYRSKERTLTDEEVEKLHSSLVEHIVRKTGGELRK
jgi:phenylalanyl-tRNA synthetase beta chain